MIEFVEFDKEFLELSWKWLNDPEVKALTNAPDITKEEQEQWFLTLKNKDNYFIWGITYKSIKIGVCGLKNVTDIEGEGFNFVGEKTHRDKGAGFATFKWTVAFARQLNLKKIYAKVLRSHKRMIKVNKIVGYTIIKEKSDNDFVYMECDITKPLKSLEFQI